MKTKHINSIEENKIENISPNELTKLKNFLARSIFNFDKMTNAQYQKFIKNFINYTAAKLNIQNATYLLDKNLKHGNASTFLYNNSMNFGKELINKPNNFKNFVNELNSIEHELLHIYKENQTKYDYKKVINENGKQRDVPVFFELNWFASYYNPRVFKLISKIARSLYIMEEDERFAYRTTIKGMQDFFKEMKNVYKTDKTLQNKKNYEKLTDFHETINFCINQIKQDENFAKIYLQPTNSALKITRQVISDFFADLTSGYLLPTIEMLQNASALLASPQLTTISDLNNYFRFLTKCIAQTNNEEVAMGCCNLAASLCTYPRNTNGIQQLKYLFKTCNIAEKNFPNLNNKLLFIAKHEFPQSKVLDTIPLEIYENEYKKYHNITDFEKFEKDELEENKSQQAISSLKNSCIEM